MAFGDFHAVAKLKIIIISLNYYDNASMCICSVCDSILVLKLQMDP